MSEEEVDKMEIARRFLFDLLKRIEPNDIFVRNVEMKREVHQTYSGDVDSSLVQAKVRGQIRIDSVRIDFETMQFLDTSLIKRDQRQLGSNDAKIRISSESSDGSN